MLSEGCATSSLRAVARLRHRGHSPLQRLRRGGVPAAARRRGARRRRGRAGSDRGDHWRVRCVGEEPRQLGTLGCWDLPRGRYARSVAAIRYRFCDKGLAGGKRVPFSGALSRARAL